MFFGKKSSVIGIDIGTGAIKAVQMKKGQAGPELMNFTIAPLPEGAMSDGQIVDTTTISSVLQEVVGSLNKKGADIYIAISGQNVVARFINAPNFSDDELNNYIMYNAEDYIPYTVDEVNMSYSKLGVVENDGVSQLVLLLVASQKEVISNFMSVFQSASITPTVMDVDTFAVLNALSSSISDEEVVSVIDIGAGITNISIINNGVLQFVRTLPMAGNNITMVIQNVLKLDFEEAENIKKEEGISMMDEEENEVSEVIRTIIEDWILDVRRSFDFYRAQKRVSAIDKIYLTGGTAKLKNLDVFLANELGIEVELADPLMGINIDNLPDQELLFDNVLELSAALGLGLRGVND